MLKYQYLTKAVFNVTLGPGMFESDGPDVLSLLVFYGSFSWCRGLVYNVHAIVVFSYHTHLLFSGRTDLILFNSQICRVQNARK